MGRGPWMIVTAAIDPAIRAEFDAWHRDVHLPHVLAIPGIAGGRRLNGPPATPAYGVLYGFEDEAALRSALASSEAQEARADWSRWSDHIRDLTVSFYAEIEGQPPIFRHN
jgi:hypothetical protein